MSENLMPPLRALASDTLAMLRFFSRIPIAPQSFEAAPHAMPDFSVSVRALPLAGALIGLISALAMLFYARLGLPHGLVIVAAMGTQAFITGAMHEDGLADVADGFFGSPDRARKLEIMKDSRLGTFGVVTLALVVLMRFAALTALLDGFGLKATLGAWIAAAAVSRAACIVPLWLLPAARSDGAAASTSRPGDQAMAISALLALLIAVLGVGLGPIGLKHAIAGCLLAAFSAFALTQLARHHIGGHTGDVAGAAQQKAELAFYIGLLIFTA